MTHASIQGNLQEIPLSATLRSLYETARTGVLRIKRENTIKELWLQKGRIVFARSNDVNDRLGVYLLKQALISVKELEFVLQNKSATQRIGNLLLDIGALSKPKLLVAIKEHLANIVYSLFSFADGDFQYLPKQIPKERVQITQNTGSLIFNGVKGMTRWKTIHRVVGPLDRVYTLVKEPVFTPDDLELAQAEKLILSDINGMNTNADICMNSTINNFNTYRSLYGFISCGIIEKSSGLLSADRQLKQAIADLYPTLAQADDHALLGVRKDVSQAKLYKQYYSLVQTFHPDKLRTLHNRQLQIKGLKILKRVQQAFERLNSLIGE